MSKHTKNEKQYLKYLSTFKKPRIVEDFELSDINFNTAINIGHLHRGMVYVKDKNKFHADAKLTDDGKYYLRINGYYSFKDTLKMFLRDLFS